LPEPDSPTTASVSPTPMRNDTPSTARTSPSSVANATLRSSISRSGVLTASGVSLGDHAGRVCASIIEVYNRCGTSRARLRYARTVRMLPGTAGRRAEGLSDMIKAIGLVQAGALALALAHLAFGASPAAAQNTPSRTTLVVAFGTDAATLETAQNSSRDTSN